MTPTRWLARLAIPMIAGAALVASAAIATADPRDDGYLDQLRGAGLTWPPGHEEALIGTAYLICDDLGWGWTPQHIANSVHANLDPDNIHVHDVGTMEHRACGLLPQPAVLGPPLLSLTRISCGGTATR